MPQIRVLAIDLELPLASLDEALMRQLDRFEPCGEANEKPVMICEARLAAPARTVGGDGEHLALSLRDGERVHRAMAFGMGARLPELALGRPIHAVYTPRWNTFRGTTALELVLIQQIADREVDRLARAEDALVAADAGNSPTGFNERAVEDWTRQAASPAPPISSTSRRNSKRIG